MRGVAAVLAALLLAVPCALDRCAVRCEARHAALTADPVCQQQQDRASVREAAGSCGLDHRDASLVAETHSQARVSRVAYVFVATPATSPSAASVVDAFTRAVEANPAFLFDPPSASAPLRI
jgi:hypothetical protein